MRVPFAASSVAIARRKLRSWLVEAGTRPEVIDDARIVISELVANSVRHARPLPTGDIVVAWEIEPRGLLISVTDGGSGTRPRTVQATSSALAGRGMAIVESLAKSWWHEQHRAQSTVHAVLAL
jgi:anti-sigma regulatory factor (Ser/Thr protein kinase)